MPPSHAAHHFRGTWRLWLHGGSHASPLSSRSLARVAALEHAPTQTRPLLPTHPTHTRQLVPPRLWPAECADTRSASRRYMARLGTLRGTARRAPVVLCHRFECVVCLRPCVAAAFSGYEALTNSCATPPTSVAADCPISLTESSASATQDSNIHTARCRRVCTSSLRLFQETRARLRWRHMRAGLTLKPSAQRRQSPRPTKPPRWHL